MDSFSWITLFGGLAIFFFGLNSARHGLQLAAGDRLRIIMHKVTGNRILAVCIGALLTLIMQSSSATTVLLVSFAETQLITMTQAIGLLLGADIGTAFVVILLSLKKITDYALLLVAFGIGLETIAKRKFLKYAGQVIFGFGMVFFGMYLMSATTTPLKDNPMAFKVFEFLSVNPGWSLTAALIFTAFVHTSAVTIGIAIALSFAGVLSLEASIPIVLGANVGTCITAVMAALPGGVEGKRVALAHVLVKVLGVAVAFPFIHQYADWLGGLDSYIVSVLPGVATTVSGKIALTHLFFNVALAIICLPFIKLIVLMVEKMIPSKLSEEEEFAPKYLDETSLDTPTLAYAQAKREIMRVAKLAYGLFATSLEMYSRNVDFDDVSEKVGSQDDKIDILEKAVRFYLAKLSQKSLTEEQAKLEMALLTIAADLEDVGDIITKEMLQLAKKKSKKMLLFSEEGWKEIKRFHSMVLENFDLMISMLTQPHEDIARKVLRHDDHLNLVEQDLRQSHINRLHEGLQESFETSSIHLDILANMRTISTKVTRIVKTSMDLT